MTNKKSLCVTYALKPTLTGIHTYLRYLEKGLSSHGWKMEIVHLDDAIPSPVIRLVRGQWGITKILFNLFPFIFTPQRNFTIRISIAKNLINRLTIAVEKSISRERPDLIHAQDIYAACAVSSLARDKKIPLVVTNHGPEKIGFGVPLSYKNFIESLEKTSYQNAQAIILVGEHLKDFVAKRAPDTPCFVIHNTINVNDFLADGRRGNPTLPKPYILIVGRLAQEKGFDIALLAFQRILETYPDFSLIIVGDGDYNGLKQLKNLASYLGISRRTHFLGWVLPECVSVFYRKAAIVWIPSRPFMNFTEPFGLVALEAMAWEKPIVASRIGGLAEIFSKGGALLVPPNNPEALAEATKKIIENPLLTKRIAKEGKRILRERYDFDQWIKKVLEVYTKVIGGKI